MVLPVSPERGAKQYPLLSTPFSEGNGAFSPETPARPSLCPKPTGPINLIRRYAFIPR